MNIKLAKTEDFEIVKNITIQTINDIYPHYYPKGAVEFFLDHHNNENIKNDIKYNKVFIYCLTNEKAVGTITIKNNEICRFFILPKYQGFGYGTALLNFAENFIFKDYNKIILDSSLPAKQIYLKKGYTATEFHSIKTNNCDYLYYDTMIKNK